MRRFRWLLLLLLLLSIVGRVWHRPAAAARPLPPPAPVVHHDGALRFHRPASQIAPLAPNPSGPAPSAPNAAIPAIDTAGPPSREIALEALPDTARSTLFHLAMDRLEALSAACEDHLPTPVALGAFATLDDAGLVELELRPIAPGGGPIQALDEALPEAYAACVEDVLWDQDWSLATADVPDLKQDKTVLKVALTTRAGDE